MVWNVIDDDTVEVLAAARAKLERARRRYRCAVMDAVSDGATYQQVGDALGITKQAVKQLVDRERER